MKRGPDNYPDLFFICMLLYLLAYAEKYGSNRLSTIYSHIGNVIGIDWFEAICPKFFGNLCAVVGAVVENVSKDVADLGGVVHSLGIGVFNLPVEFFYVSVFQQFKQSL